MNSESLATAISHLEMIFQAAEGDYSPRPGELAKRKTAVLSYLMTGQCAASESDRALAREMGKVVTTHLASQTPEAKENIQ